jgi:hypothetical protein
MKPIKRIPRPQGLTLQAQNLNLITNPQQYTKEQNKVKEHVLNMYLINNNKLNGQYYTLDQIAKILNMSELHVLKVLNKRMGFLAGFNGNDPKELHDTARATFFRQFWGLLKAAQNAEYQADTLIQVQGGKYVPYVTDQVNKAIANQATVLNAATNFLRILKPEGQGPSPNLFEAEGASSHRGPEPNTLTVEGAVRLLAQGGHNNLLESNDAKQVLYLNHGLNNVPEVRQNYQTGSDTKVINPDEPATQNQHEDRRERDMGAIDQDEI